VPARQRDMVERIRARAAVLSEIVADLLVLAGPGQMREGRRRSPATCARCSARQSACSRPLPGEGGDPRSRGAAEGLPEPGQGAGAGDAAPHPTCLVALPRADLRSVATNLVSNAVKYSRPGGRAAVRLDRDAESIRLTVSDQGIGIPAAERERLFSEFFRASNARTFSDSGTGLGLAIVKSIVDRLGGTIAVESEEARHHRPDRPAGPG